METIRIVLLVLCLFFIGADPATGGETGRSRIILNGEWGFQPLILDQDPAVEKGVRILREKYSQEEIDRHLPKIIRGDIRPESLPKDAQEQVRMAYRAYKEAFEQQIKAFSGAPPRVFRQKITVPSFWTYTKDFGYPEEWKRARAAWYGKSFLVPEDMKDRIITLRFEAVNCLAKVFVNGGYVGRHTGGFTPFEMDITDLVRPGSQNTLNVFVQDGSAVMTPAGQYTAPVGEIEQHPGIWQGVSLRSYPKVHLQDVVIKTSVGGRSIRVDVSIKSHLDRVVNGSVKADVGQGVALGEKGFRIQPKGESGLVFEKKWEDPVLWSPRNPHLYHLTLTLSVPTPEKSPITDQISQSFGFREFRVEGTSFFLNGRRVRLRGDSINRIPSAYFLTPEYVRAFFEAAKQTHMNTVRLHTAVFPEFVLDIADEMGMLIIDEAPILGWTPYDLSDLAHFKHFFREWVSRDRNHPSVIIWSALNECLYYKRRVVPFKEMIRAGDDTRPVKFEGNGDAYGVADIFDIHYPGEDHLPRLLVTLLENRSKERLDGFRYHGQVWSGDKPISAGEFSPIFHASPDQIAFLGGEGIYEGMFSGRDNYDAAVGEFTALQVETMRRLQFAHIAPWSTLNYGLRWMKVDLPELDPDRATSSSGMRPRRIVGHYSFSLNPGFLPGEPMFRKTALYDKIRDALTPLGFSLGKPKRTAYDNTLFGDTWSLHNDTDMDIRGKLVYGAFLSGRMIDEKSVELEIPSGQSTHGSVGVNVPRVDKKEALRLDVRVTDEQGGCLLSRSYAYTVYPERLLSDPVDSLSGITIGIYDKTGRTSKILLGMGVRARNVRPPVDSDLDLLIIGKDSLDMAMADAAKTYARQGGKVLVFEQDSPSAFHRLAEGNLRLEMMHSPIAFSLAPGHPVFRDVTRDDLRFWGGDYLVSRLNFHKPTGGVFRMLAEAGGKDGLTHTPLLEMGQGKGIYIVSQLLLVEKFYDEPMAAVLLRNILSYAGALKTGHLPKRRLLIIHDRENGSFMDFVREISIPFERSPSALLSEAGVHDPVMIVADSINWSTLKKNKEYFLDYLKRGGEIVVQGLTPLSAAHFNGVFETDVRVAPTSLLHPQVEKAGPLEALWGISNHDLVWAGNPVRFVAHSGTGEMLIKEPLRTAEFPQGLRWGDALRFPQATARAVADPGAAILRIPYGKGAILINQLLPLTSEPKSKICFSTLFSNQLLNRANPAEKRVEKTIGRLR